MKNKFHFRFSSCNKHTNYSAGVQVIWMNSMAIALKMVQEFIQIVIVALEKNLM